MLAFVLALFPATGVLGAGQFVFDKGVQSWLGWTQLVTLIGQMAVLFMLRQSIVQHSDMITAGDVMRDQDTQPLLILALLLLALGLGQYLYGIWRTLPTDSM
jgi:hypothetical protein